MQMVGSVLYEPPQALPQDLQSYLDGCSQGAVYVSMGTLGILTEAELHSLAGGLTWLPQCVLWKLSVNDLPGTALASHCSDLSLVKLTMLVLLCLAPQLQSCWHRQSELDKYCSLLLECRSSQRRAFFAA